MELKIRFTNHLKALASGLYITILTIIAVYFIGSSAEFDTGLFKFFGIYLLINILPAVYIHIEYYLCNRGEEYNINKDQIIQYKAGKERHFHKSELTRILVYMPPSAYKGSNLHFLAIEGYSYAKVITKSGEELFITCLLTPQIEEVLKQLSGVPFERKKRLFNTLD